jgi:multidrug/hemolysin transport system ATP-binding protein
VWETITALQRDTGMTVFLSTHYMEEAAGADYVIVIDDGLIAAKGTPSSLKEAYTTDKLSLFCADPQKVGALLEAEALPYTQKADQILVPIPTTMSALPILQKVGDFISGFEVSTGTMDDAFIAITGKEIRE